MKKIQDVIVLPTMDLNIAQCRCIKCERVLNVKVVDWSEYETLDTPLKWTYMVFGLRIFYGCPTCFPLDSSSNEVLLEFAQACAESSTLW
jgi:hypothetical protein